MSTPQKCPGGEKLIFACSGAADVGAISDRAARELTRKGVGKMLCLAGIGGRVEGILQKTRDAPQILAIDGCSLDCTKQCLEQAGLANFAHMCIADMGMEKGETPATEENVASVVEAASALLA